MFQELYGINNEKGEPAKKDTGDFIRLIIKDIMSEEKYVTEDGKEINEKNTNAKIATMARQWFIAECDKV